VKGEITPVRAEQSATFEEKEKYAAKYAIDLDIDTKSYATRGSDGTAWLKLTLDQVYCVEQVVWYYYHGGPLQTRTCSTTGCTCQGDYCKV
jgi:hypothetical protein